MKNKIKVIIVSLLIALPAISFAQKAYKFGHFSSADIFQIIPDRDTAMNKLQKFQKELELQVEAMQVEYNNKLQKYVDEKEKLTDLIKKTREEELTQMQQRLQQFQENAQQEMQKKQNELTQPIFEKIKKALSDVGKENGFTYIFDIQPQALMFVSADSQDVTPLIKQKLGITATKK